MPTHSALRLWVTALQCKAKLAEQKYWLRNSMQSQILKLNSGYWTSDHLQSCGLTWLHCRAGLMHWGKVEGRKQLPSTAFLFLQKAHGEGKDGQWPEIRTTGAPELRTTNDQTQICRIVNNFHVLKHGLNQYLLRHKKISLSGINYCL